MRSSSSITDWFWLLLGVVMVVGIVWGITHVF